MSIKYKKPNALFDEFVRKGDKPEITHYCPGCGHGTAHNLIGEAIDELGIQDNTIFCSPVGCAVFGYHYFDTGNIQCSHGRAPAVATAIRRSHPEAVIISYQGDGDLAGIGLSHIIHAANRGENITVFFINNVIYGMTGGQMAPTTLLGTRTATTPFGRTLLNDGAPMKMCEIISQVAPPVYVERVSLADTKRIMQARKAIRKALTAQIEGRGFSFVEILAPCPINWKMTPVKAREWMIETMEQHYPLGCLRDTIAESAPESFRPPAIKELPDDELLEIILGDAILPDPKVLEIEDQSVVIGGIGGQGILSTGMLLGACATKLGYQCTCVPSYGPEMRGGNSHVSVSFSNASIDSPIIAEPNVLLALTASALDFYENAAAPGALVLVNSSIVKRKVERTDVRVVEIPASEIAQEAGAPAALTNVLLTAYVLISGTVPVSTLKEMLGVMLKRKNLLESNLKAIDAAVEYCRVHGLIAEKDGE